MSRYKRDARIDAWQPDQDAYLVKHYGLRPVEEIAAYIGRSKHATRNRAFRLGIQKARTVEFAQSVADRWSESDREYLDRNYGAMTLRALSAVTGHTVYNIRKVALDRGLRAPGRNRITERLKAADPLKTLLMGVAMGESVEYLASCYSTRPATVRKLLGAAGLESVEPIRLPDPVRDRLLNLLDISPADTDAVVRGLNAVRRLLQDTWTSHAKV